MTKIDLVKLGLSSESTFEEIQKKLSELILYDEAEVTTLKDAAASGARKAAEAKLGKSTLSKEELAEYKKYQNDTKMSNLKENKTIKKFSEDDQELIIKAEKLIELTEEELSKALLEVETKYSKRVLNELPSDASSENDDENDDDDDDADDPWD